MSREQVAALLSGGDLRFIRLAWGDLHGYVRSKLVTPEVALDALANGYNTNMATTMLDASGARTFSSFTRGGGMGMEELTGSPNLLIRPEASTFRVLPWEPSVGWMLCDDFFTNGQPSPFSPRQILKRQIARLAGRGMAMKIGLEVEWYLLRQVQEVLGPDNIGEPGRRGKPVATAPVEPGYHYHSESNLDLMQPILLALGDAYRALGLPLRSIENEWGPGQVECTFGPCDALAAADNMFLFRSATRQICRRHGYFATFMACPAIEGYYASGWHLHQSLVEANTGRNILAADAGTDPSPRTNPLSPLGRNHVGGILEHAAAGTLFATPTVNGFRRIRPNSLAPDRATWAYDHRGVMLRVLGGPGDAATRIENRLGEPSANPYLFIAAQIAAGLDGIDRGLDPGAQDLEPYAGNRPPLPRSLGAALDLTEANPMFAEAFGETFMGYYIRLKRTELGRYTAFLDASGQSAERPTEWEQNEYFDFF